MLVDIWSKKLGKQVKVDDNLAYWVDECIIFKEERTELKTEIEKWKKAHKALCDQTLEDGKTFEQLKKKIELLQKMVDELESSNEAVGRLLASGFVPS